MTASSRRRVASSSTLESHQVYHIYILQSTFPNPGCYQMATLDKTKFKNIENPVVRRQAEALLRRARSVTGPGTGYDISDAGTALPPICAYLASRRYISYHACGTHLTNTRSTQGWLRRCKLRIRKRNGVCGSKHLQQDSQDRSGCSGGG